MKQCKCIYCGVTSVEQPNLLFIASSLKEFILFGINLGVCFECVKVLRNRRDQTLKEKK